MKKMRFFAVILAVLLTAALCATAALADDPQIVVSSASAQAGDTNVTITVSLQNNPGINTFTLTAEYDTTRLKLEEGVVALSGNQTFAASTGTVVWQAGADTTANGTAVTLTFSVPESAPAGEASVTVSYQKGNICNFNEDDVDFKVIPGKVTVSPAPHDHVWGEGTVTTAAACESAGVRTFTCSVCGEQRTEAIPATGHSWDEGKITTAATCEGKGVKTYTCQNDASHTRMEEIAATGHSWDAGKVTKEATCKDAGVKTYTCKNDASHTRTEELPKTDHTWDAGKVTTEPTCKDEGVKTYTCSVCGEQKTEAVPKTDVHTIDPDADKTAAADATLTKKGNIEYWTCSVCGKLFLDAAGKTETTKAEVEYDAQFEERLELSEVAEEDAAALEEAVTAASFSAENCVMVEATLMVSLDNGETWTVADELPAGGAAVAFDYPAGTNAKDHDFVIFHLKADGTVETLTPTEGDKLIVTVTSLSPFAIAWKDAPEQGAGGAADGARAVKSPSTGDGTPIALWAVMLLACGAGLAMMRKKARA